MSMVGTVGITGVRLIPSPFCDITKNLCSMLPSPPMYFPTSGCARIFAAIGVPEPRPHRKPVSGPAAPIARQGRSMNPSQHSGMHESLCF